ncbi:MAG: hypothetical protein O3A88_05160 [Proteobacteria bacterium]|nr:hypothetical protein [Pseudomonadota bacterium]
MKSASLPNKPHRDPMTTHNERQRMMLAVLYVLLFVAVVPKAIGALTEMRLLESEFRFNDAFETNILTNSVRYGGVILGSLIEWVITTLSDGLDIVRDSMQDPDQYVPPRSSVPELNHFLASLVYRFLLLLPLLVVAVRWVRPVWAGALFLALMFAAIGGFGAAHEFLARTLYWAILPKMTLYFFDLRQGTYYIDFLAMGFLPLLALELERGIERPWRLLALTAFGQLSYEHFGFVCGVAGAVFILLRGPGTDLAARARRAVALLAVTGLISLAVIAVLLLPGVLERGFLTFVSGNGSGWEGFIKEASANRANWKHVIARLAYFLAPAFLVGAALGLSVALRSESIPEAVARQRLAAVAAVLTGFTGAVLIGFFALTNFSAEMGREFLQAVPLVFLFGFQAAYLGGLRLRTVARMVPPTTAGALPS